MSKKSTTKQKYHKSDRFSGISMSYKMILMIFVPISCICFPKKQMFGVTFFWQPCIKSQQARCSPSFWPSEKSNQFYQIIDNFARLPKKGFVVGTSARASHHQGDVKGLAIW